MNMEPLISIVIPMYNAEGVITDTLNSISNQTYKNYEVILVDNASTDNSLSIVEKISKSFNNLKIIKCEFNSGGPAKPRNIGISEARGDYIAFLDADDIWSPNKLSHQINYMIDYNLDFSSTDSNCFSSDSTYKFKYSLISKLKKSYFKTFFSMKTLVIINCISTSSVVVKCNGLSFSFDEDKSLNSVEDLHLWLTLIHAGFNYKYLDSKLLEYRVEPTSLSSQNSLVENKVKTSLAVLKFIEQTKSFNLYSFFIIRQLFRLLGR